MSIIARDWREGYLRTAVYVTINTIILTFFLRAVLRKDHLFKSFMLALPICLLSVLTMDDLYLSEKKQTLTEIDISVFFFLAATQLYIVALGCLAIIVRCVEWLIGDEPIKIRLKANLNQLVIVFSFIFAAVIATFYLIFIDLG
jgi:hypothetical protein